MYHAAKAGWMEIIAYASIAYLAMQLLVALVNLVSHQMLKPGALKIEPLVSILIPARNEEDNIGNLLDDLSSLDYDRLEILVYDDDSSDLTASIIHEKILKDNRIRYINSAGLHPGWLGKNHACHQLARQSGGDFLLFLDADVRLQPALLRDSMAFMEKFDLQLLSVFPVQIMKTLGEWLTVPLMNRILLGNLPLILVHIARLQDFAAANGQFMLFNAKTYKKHWFHELVKNEKVEDIRIIRILKGLKYKVQTLLSGGQIECRMYRGFGEGLEGFSKNIHAFFGKNWLILLLYVFLTTIGPLAVWLSISPAVFFSYLAGTVIFRTLVSAQSRQSVWINLVLMPLQQLTLIVISGMAAYRHFSGNLYWKGRRI
jgi:glycosyltransferase involved in cell wall biosynthesis